MEETKDVGDETCARCGKPATDYVGAPLCQKHAKIERAKNEAKRIYDKEAGSFTKSGLANELNSSGFSEDVSGQAAEELDEQGELKFEQKKVGEVEDLGELNDKGES